MIAHDDVAKNPQRQALVGFGEGQFEKLAKSFGFLNRRSHPRCFWHCGVECVRIIGDPCNFWRATEHDRYGEGMTETLHVFSGVFGSRENACRYSEQQWERPAPDDSWSQVEYSAWEDRNPTWLLRQDLTVENLDPDFIETIFGSDKMHYLASQLTSEADRQKLFSEIPQQTDTLILIMSAAFDGKKASLSSTPKLRYHGEYDWQVA